MKIAKTHSPQDSLPFSVLEPVPPEVAEVAPLGSAYRLGTVFVVENGSELPVHVCVKCGRPAKKPLSLSLRSPSDPRTWFGRRPSVEVGLCQKHLDDDAVAKALTWSLLGLGTFLLLVGIATYGPATGVVGLVVMTVSGFPRARGPLVSGDAAESRVIVAGACESFLSHLPDRIEEFDSAGQIKAL